MTAQRVGPGRDAFFRRCGTGKRNGPCILSCHTKLWQVLLTLPPRRPEVSSIDSGGTRAVRPGPRNGVGGVWRPAPLLGPEGQRVEKAEIINTLHFNFTEPQFRFQTVTREYSPQMPWPDPGFRLIAPNASCLAVGRSTEEDAGLLEVAWPIPGSVPGRFSPGRGDTVWPACWRFDLPGF